MPARSLDLEVLRRGRHEAGFQAFGDPEDHAWLVAQLRSWLRDNRWDEGRWGEFVMHVREAGGWTRLKEVRPR